MSSRSDNGRTHTLPRGLHLAISFLLMGSIVACALLVVGGYGPSIPYLGVFGSVAVSLWPGWLVIAPTVSAIILWPLAGRLTRRLALAVSVATALGASNVVYQLTSVATHNDVEVSWLAPFGMTNSLSQVPQDEIVTYVQDAGDNLTLRLYYPRGVAPRDGWPVLMYIHGGGWVSQSNAQRSSDMRWFADHGWIVVSVGYSLSSPDRHLWDRAHAQIGCAMVWVANYIDAKGGNARHLAMFGESAGGNLVLNASYMANAGVLPSVCPGTVPRIVATSAIYPGVDLAAIADNKYSPTGPMVREMVYQYVGGPENDLPERYRAVNSATYISPQAPPTLLVISRNDHLVPLESMQRFDRRIREAGITGKTIEVPFAEHGFDIAGVGNSIVRQATLSFLNSVQFQ